MTVGGGGGGVAPPPPPGVLCNIIGMLFTQVSCLRVGFPPGPRGGSTLRSLLVYISNHKSWIKQTGFMSN